MNHSAAANPLVPVIDLQWQIEQQTEYPSSDQIESWARAAIEPQSASAQHSTAEALATIRIVSAAEIAEANGQWRQKQAPTNVLSFPADYPAEAGIDYFGDMLVCAEVVESERIAQCKPADAHWAHIVVHGMLHLQGFDHLQEDEAETMERREVEILATLGFPDPYQSETVEVNQS